MALCADCKRLQDLQDNASLTGGHLVDPHDPARHAVDVHGNAVCPTCGALWNKPEGKRPWSLTEPGESTPNAKRAPTKRRA